MLNGTSNINGDLELAFRAAFLLTGNANLAESAVLEVISNVAPDDGFRLELVHKTIESLFRKGTESVNRWERAPADTHVLKLLALMTPVYRDCFLLQVVFRIPAVKCAAILHLTAEEFEELLDAAFRELSAIGRPDTFDQFHTSKEGVRK